MDANEIETECAGMWSKRWCDLSTTELFMRSREVYQWLEVTCAHEESEQKQARKDALKPMLGRMLTDADVIWVLRLLPASFTDEGSSAETNEHYLRCASTERPMSRTKPC